MNTNRSDKFIDHYDCNEEFADRLSELIPGFNHSAWIDKTIGEVLDAVPVLFVTDLAYTLSKDKPTLEDYIQMDLVSTRVWFEVYDPFMDINFRFVTADAATMKAVELNADKIQVIHPTGVMVIKRMESGSWVDESGLLSLSDIQDKITSDSLRNIRIRARLRKSMVSCSSLDPLMVLADAHAFRCIHDVAHKRSAANLIELNAETYPGYLAGLEQSMPGYPGTVAMMIAGILLDNNFFQQFRLSFDNQPFFPKPSYLLCASGLA